MQRTDCVVYSTDDDIALVVRVAGDTEFRREIQSKVHTRSSLLFEDPAEVRCFEQALKSIAS